MRSCCSTFSRRFLSEETPNDEVQPMMACVEGGVGELLRVSGASRKRGDGRGRFFSEMIGADSDGYVFCKTNCALSMNGKLVETTLSEALMHKAIVDS